MVVTKRICLVLKMLTRFCSQLCEQMLQSLPHPIHLALGFGLPNEGGFSFAYLEWLLPGCWQSHVAMLKMI